MDEKILSLNDDELKQLHRKIGGLIVQRRSEKIEAIKAQIASLGINPAELAPKRTKPAHKANAGRYRDPENPENVYGGKGPKPQWLKDALENGRTLEDFAVA